MTSDQEAEFEALMKEYGTDKTKKLLIRMIETGRDQLMPDIRITPVEAHILAVAASEIIRDIQECAV